MDMEQRKVNWANRIYAVLMDLDGISQINPVYIRRLVSICQDAFNEGHKAGYALDHEDGYSQAAKEMEDDC